MRRFISLKQWPTWRSQIISKLFKPGAVVFLLGSILASCTTTLTPHTKIDPPPLLSWQARSEQLNRLQNWHLNGKVAVQTAKDAGSATIDWSENHNRYLITLSGPLGSHAIELKGRPGQVTLTNEKGQHFSASNAESLLAKQWGYHFPISNLIYWIRGLPVPNLPSQNHFDQRNRLVSLKQAGWEVRYLSYQTVKRIELPERIQISAPQLKSKIIIYQWHLS